MLLPFMARHLWLRHMTTAFTGVTIGAFPTSHCHHLYLGKLQKQPTTPQQQRCQQQRLFGARSKGATPSDTTMPPTSSSSSSSPPNAPFLEFQYRIPLEESDYSQVLYTDNVPSASLAFQELTDLLGNPREPNEARFQWDPWFVRCDQYPKSNDNPSQDHIPTDQMLDQKQQKQQQQEWNVIPGEQEATARQVQYSMTRSQCSMIFSDQVFGDLVDDITGLGRSIGCTAITPPWISLYGDGQMQNFHIDPTQGTMAWTLCLSVGYGSTFTGGETILLRDDVLDYWRDYDGKSRGKEAPSLVRFLPPLFGRLTAFDPRIPHMVQPVSARGVGPLDARIMIHGWFAEPEIVWFSQELEDSTEAQSILNTCLESIMETLSSSEIGRVMGFLSVRLSIDPDGSVNALEAVCDTLREDPSDFSGVVGYDEEDREVLEDSTADVRLTIREALGNLNFPQTKEGGGVVIPFDFV